jgi:hypothetical protein
MPRCTATRRNRNEQQRAFRVRPRRVRSRGPRGGCFTTSGERAGWASIFDEFARHSRARTEPETTGETGDGVWAIHTVDDEGGAHIEQVYPTELDALRANKGNTDPARKVRFLPYGIAVSVLDASE